MFQYDIASKSITFSNTSHLSPYGITAVGQAYAQYGSSLYAIAMQPDSISLFNMKTLEYVPSSTPIPFSYGDGYYYSESSCLVHTGTHLVVSGGNYWAKFTGRVYMNDVLTYNLTAALWDNVLPNMIRQRSTHSCVFAEEEGVIYSIAGSDSSNYWRSIEKLDVNDGTSWQDIGSMSADNGGDGTRAVYYQQGAAVYVLGGSDSSTTFDTVHKIDVQTDAITLQPGMRLPYAMDSTACTIIIHTIWCAGGENQDPGFLDTIIKYSLVLRIYSIVFNIETHHTKYISFRPTVQPTAEPTDGPTVHPSAKPTNYPTNVPTLNPTADPTGNPTSDASNEPTVDPSTKPTNYPTNDPKLDSTDDPTNAPSNEPTVHPTHYPSDASTIDPAIYPSVSPTIMSSDYLITFQVSPNVTVKDIEEIVVQTLIAKYDVELISVVVDKDGSVQILIASLDEGLTTESIRSTVGEVLEEEYGDEIEVSLTANDETSEANDFVSEFWLFGLIVLSLTCCCIFSLITFFCLRHKHKAFNQHATNLRIASMSGSILTTQPELAGQESKGVTASTVGVVEVTGADGMTARDSELMYGTNTIKGPQEIEGVSGHNVSDDKESEGDNHEELYTKGWTTKGTEADNV